MRDLGTFSKFYLAIKPVDFRKQAHGLALIVDHTLNLKAVSDRIIFAFTNKKKTAIKLLYWDGTGFALWWKTLEKERFRWPREEQDAINLPLKELKWLLEGIDIRKIKTHTKLSLE